MSHLNYSHIMVCGEVYEYGVYGLFNDHFKQVQVFFNDVKIIDTQVENGDDDLDGIEELIIQYVESVIGEVANDDDAMVNDDPNVCNSREDVYRIIDGERDYSDGIWESEDKVDSEKSVAEWLVYMRYHLDQAFNDVYMMSDECAMSQVRRIAGLAVACMEYNEVSPRLN